MINEKDKPIEFTYSSSENPNFEVDIVYDRNNPLTVKIGSISYEINMLVEIIDFLKGKGIIKSTSIRGSSVNKNISSLPIPEIVKDEGREEKQEMKPLISLDGLLSKESSDEKDVKTETPNVLKDSEEKPKEKVKKEEIINRPVIRSRVTGEDPTSAEKEASLIRGSMSDNEKSSVKRKY